MLLHEHLTRTAWRSTWGEPTSFVGLQKQQKDERRAKKAAGQPAAAGSMGQGTPGHPWRPFDRDKDLGQRPKAASAAAMKGVGSLSSRFG